MHAIGTWFVYARNEFYAEWVAARGLFVARKKRNLKARPHSPLVDHYSPPSRGHLRLQSPLLFSEVRAL